MTDLELPCAGCEYDLRGLPADGRCPECGEAVAIALERDTLHYADPRWLRRLIVAGWLVPGGLVCVVLLEVVRSFPFGLPAVPMSVLRAVVELAMVLAFFAGPLVLLLSSPGDFLRRPVLRLAALVAIAISLAAEVVMQGVVIAMSWLGDVPGGMTDRSRYDAFGKVMEVVASVSTIATGVALTLACFYAAAPLRRLPRTSLPWWFTLAGWTIGVSWMLGSLVLLAQWIGWFELSSPADFPDFDLKTFAFLALVLCGYAGVLLGVVLSPIASIRLRRIRRMALRLRSNASL